MANSTTQTNETAAPPPGAGKASGSGLMAWLPLGLTFLLMPALAYLMTMFVLVPKMQKALGGGANVEARETESGESSAGGHGGAASSHGKEASGAGGKAKFKVPLSKLVVNVSGSLGTRMLLVSLTLAGNSPDLKARIENESDQLRDLASSVLSTKTITDLEKPEARNLIRAELLSQFNTVLGGGAVQEIYITEFAIQ